MPIRGHGSRLLHHLSKPMHGNMVLDCSSPQAKKLTQIEGLPLPSRPINSYNVCSPRLSPRPFSPLGLIQSPQASRTPITYTRNNIGYPYYMPESRFQVEPPMAIVVEDIDDRDDQIEEGNDYDEIIRGISELCKRLPSELREQVDLEAIKKRVTTTKERGLNGGCAPNSGRGLRRPVEDMSHKLERFKTKTIKVGEVVKVESDRK